MNRLVRKLYSETGSKVLFTVLCLIFFAGQSYIFITRTFPNVSKPFASSFEVQSFVQDALWDVWLRMLIWPALLFMILTIEIISLWKKKRGQKNQAAN